MDVTAFFQQDLIFCFTSAIVNPTTWQSVLRSILILTIVELQRSVLFLYPILPIVQFLAVIEQISWLCYWRASAATGMA